MFDPAAFVVRLFSGDTDPGEGLVVDWKGGTYLLSRFSWVNIVCTKV